MTNYSEEDVGNIISLEHVNVQISDQALATLFYVVGIGGTRDPYLNVGLNNMWVNVGEQQFHFADAASPADRRLHRPSRARLGRAGETARGGGGRIEGYEVFLRAQW
jgi:hypothetical protein